MKKTIITTLIAASLSSMLSACGQPFVNLPSSSPVLADSGDVQTGPDKSITLADEQGQPLRMLSVAFGHYDRDKNKTAWKAATTNLAGYFSTDCEKFCEIEIQAEGYWPYSGPSLDPARIRLAARTEAERTGKALSLQKYQVLSLRGYTLSQDESIHSFADLFETDPKSGQSSFQVNNAQELEAVVAKLSRLSPEFLKSASPDANIDDTIALMRKTIAEGKRLVGYSNNEFFRYFAQIEELHETADSYYFSQNRTRLLTDRGMSGHSYDTELIVYALPADGKKVVFHGASGKLELKP